MKKDCIAEVGIDEQERLYVVPASATFPYIYREAMEVHWDSEHSRLHSPTPRDWTHFDWFRQIVKAAAEQSCDLNTTIETRWVNTPAELKEQIENWIKEGKA